MDNCIFCKIVSGQIPCYKFWEDENVLAFLDINPYVVGHVLVVPKKHFKWIWDMKYSEYLDLMESVKYLANVLKKAFETDWVEEMVAGIGVKHAHIHLFPRREDDGIGEFPMGPLNKKLSEEDMLLILEKIRSCL